MADLSSREKAVYWVLIIVVALAGGGALAYYFVTARDSATSLSGAVAGQSTTGGTVSTYSLTDIIAGPGNDTGKNDVAQPPIVSPTPQPPIVSPQPQPPIVAPDPEPKVNQVITAEPQVTPQNFVLTDQPLNTNDLLNRPTVSNAGVTSAAGSLASGSGLPTDSPTTGVEVLVLSGVASLGISGAATMLALRKPKSRSRKARS